MKVVVVGAGNIGLAITAYLANKQYDVTLFTQKEINKLKLNDVDAKKISVVKNYKVTSNPLESLQTADVIFCTYPAFLRKKFVEQYGSVIKKRCFLGFVPGYGGIEYNCTKLIQNGITIFGLQRVPYVARAYKEDESYIAGILSKKNNLYVAAIPYVQTATITKIIEDLLDIPCKSLKEYLAITLAPSNPLLHITGLYGAFHNWKAGQNYTGSHNFYEVWNDETSEILFKYDSELQKVCNQLDMFNLQEVVPLPIYYESDSPRKMTKKLKSIKAFEAVKLPLQKTAIGYVPDLNSRMFVEDYPFGVCVIKDFAIMTNTSTPIVDLMLEFCERMTGVKYFNNDNSYTNNIGATGIPGIAGINSQLKLNSFYH